MKMNCVRDVGKDMVMTMKLQKRPGLAVMALVVPIGFTTNVLVSLECPERAQLSFAPPANNK